MNAVFALSTDDRFEGRIDYLELLISTLRDHEKQLNDVADTLTANINTIRDAVKLGGSVASRPPIVKVWCEQWSEFKRRCTRAQLVTFSLREQRLTVHAVADNMFAYAEPLPVKEFHVQQDEEPAIIDGLTPGSLDDMSLAFRLRLDCGLDGTFVPSRHAVSDGEDRVQLRFTLDAGQVRTWLAKELQVPSINIVEGSIT